ncbi:MAG TPA: hypothetical protein VGH20_22440 [Myxococcales bacterium]|jgi:hypothetical protein
MNEAPAWQAFERELLPRIAKNFPLEASLMGAEGLAELAASSAANAARYGFSLGRHVAQYVQLALALGCGFDCDPLLPWASIILRSRSAKDADTKMAALNAAALAYVEAVAGWNGRRYRAAILRMRNLGYGHFPALGRDSSKALIAHLRSLFPEKAAYTADSLPVFADLAARSAQRFGLVEGPPFAVYASLLFLLGNGFADDPQFAWAGKALSSKRGAGPERIARDLVESGQAWIARVLAVSGRG